MIIKLPSQLKVNYNSGQTTLNCSIVEPQNTIVKGCVSLNSSAIKITLGSAVTDAFQINIYNSTMSPPSSSPTSSLGFYTYESTTQALQDYQNNSILIKATAGSLQSATYTSLISQQVGAVDQVKLVLKSKNPIMLNGTIQLVFPYWFNVSSVSLFQSMIDVTQLQCYVYSSAGVSSSTSCTFSQSSQSLTFTSLFNSTTLASGQTLTLSVLGIKNPISTLTHSSIIAQTTDPLLGVIDSGTITLSATSPSDITIATLTVGNSLVQQSSQYNIQFSVKVPLYAGCLVTIYLPWPDYDLTSDTIDQVQVFGLFGTLRSVTFSVNSKLNTITISNACLTYALPSIAANIYILGLTNPATVKQTGNFSINIVDANNGQVAQLAQTNGFNFSAQSGNISNIAITPDITINNQSTNFTLYFTPQHSTTNLVNLTINLNDTNFSFSSGVVFDSNITNISLSTIQLLNSQTLEMYGFTPSFVAGSTYYLKIQSMKLSPTVKSLSQLWVNISQIDVYSNPTVYYLIDSSYISNSISTVTGQFYKAYCTPQSLTTSNTTQYEFLVQTQNDIPAGGFLEIQLPSDITVDSLKLNCLQYGVVQLCQYQQSNNTIKITGFFTLQLYPKQSDLSFIIQGIINPRSTKPTSQFYYRTFAPNFGQIDQYTSTSAVVIMTTPANLTSQNVSAVSSLRVADVNTKITFTLSFKGNLVTNDSISITIPDQVTLPDSTLVKCTSTLSKFTNSSLSCSMPTYNQLKLQLALKNDILLAGSALDLSISGFTNPSNGRPTDNFQVAVYDQNSYQIAQLQNSTLKIQMTLPQLLTNGYSIATSDQTANYETIIQLTFTSGQTIPIGSYIVLTYPSQLGLIQSDLIISSSKAIGQPNYTVSISNRKITAYQFFTLSVQSGSQVILTISGFVNSNYSTPTDSFLLDIFTNDSYPINSIQSGLQVASKCDFPCRDCNLVSGGPTTCTACSTKDIAPNYYILQSNRCLSQCSTGYYYVGSQSSGSCLPCDSTCYSCNGLATNCTECKGQTGFPYLYQNTCVNKCLSYQITDTINSQCLDCQLPCKNCSSSPTKCTTCINNTFWLGGQCLDYCPPSGLYIGNQNSWVCQSCSSNCSTCQVNTTTCTSCPSGFKLNKIDNTCITSCPTGTTEQVQGICSICSANCKTCQTSINSCTSCQGNQLLSSGQCVGTCPAGQTQNGNICLNCSSECSTCINGNPNTCTACKSGYFNYNYSQCLSTCPSPYIGKNGFCIDPNLRCNFGYQVSQNGTVCVLSAYTCNPGYEINEILKKCVPVPGFYFPFPFLILLILLTTIMLLVLKVKHKIEETNIVQSIICLWCPFEPLIYLIQFILACIYEHISVLLITVFALLFYYPLNWYIIRIVINRRFNKDSVIQHWATEYPRSCKYIMRFSLFHNQKLLRLLTCSFLGKPQFQAAFDDINMNYIKPQLRATVINALSSYLLILVADITCFITVGWGYQLLIVCIESLIFILVMITLQIIDYFQLRHHYMRKHEYYKVNAKSIDMSTVRGGFDDNDTPGAEENSKVKLRQKSQDRRALLEKITNDLDQQEKNKKNYENLDFYLMSAPLHEGFNDEQDENSKLYNLEQTRNVNLIPNQSTLNHLAENRENMIDNESRDEEVWDQCISERNQDQYGDMEALEQARDLFEQINQQIVQQRLERQRLQDIMEYNAKMAMQEGNEDLKVHLNRPQYSLDDVLGQFQRDQDGNYLIIKNQEGQLVDQIGRLVNKRGYLIDQGGNIITREGQFVLQRELIDQNEDIPIKIFKRLFMPIQADQVSHTSRSNKQLSAALSRSQNTVLSLESGRISRSMNDMEIEAQKTFMSRKRGSGGRSVKSIGIDPISYHSQTTIVNQPEERIVTQEEPYQIDIQFDDGFQRKPTKKGKKRVKTAHREGKQIKRNLKLKQTMTMKGSNQDLGSQISSFTQQFSHLPPAERRIKYKSSQMLQKVSTGRSKSQKSAVSNQNGEKLNKSHETHNDRVDEDIFNTSYQVNMFNPRKKGSKKSNNNLRDSGTVTLKQHSVYSNLSKHTKEKRKYNSSLNVSDRQPSTSTQGRSQSQNRIRPKQLAKRNKSQDTISETQSQISKVIKPRVPQQQLQPQRVQSNGRGKKGTSGRYLVPQPSVHQDPDMFSINITIPRDEHNRSWLNNSKERKKKVQKKNIIQQMEAALQRQREQQRVGGLFNLIDFDNKLIERDPLINEKYAYDPLTQQLNRLLKKEKQQIEDLRRQAFENQTTAKKPEQLNINNNQYMMPQFKIQNQVLTPSTENFFENFNNTQPQSFKIQNETLQKPNQQPQNIQNFDNMTTVKKQQSLGNKLQTLQNDNISTIITPNAATSSSAQGVRSTLNMSGRLIMNQHLNLKNKGSISSMTQQIYSQNSQVKDPQTNNYFKSVKSGQSIPSIKNSDSQILDNAQVLINELRMQARPGSSIRAGNPTTLDVERQNLQDMKARFHPSLISPTMMSAQSINEYNQLNRIHDKFENKQFTKTRKLLTNAYGLNNNSSLNQQILTGQEVITPGIDEYIRNPNINSNNRPNDNNSNLYQAYGKNSSMLSSSGMGQNEKVTKNNNNVNHRKPPQAKNNTGAGSKLQNMREIYSQNVRANSNIGVQPKSQLRGIPGYDQFSGGGIALNTQDIQGRELNRGGQAQQLLNNQSEDEIGDPFKTLNRIFSQK